METDRRSVPERELFEARLAAIESLRERDLSAGRELAASHRMAHEREHRAVEIAIEKAEQSMNVRLEAMNEFRRQLDRERGGYVTTERMDDRLKGLTDRIATLERVQENMAGRFAAASVGLVIVMFLIGVVLRFL